MPRIDLARLQNKTTQHPEKTTTMIQVSAPKMERIAITVDAAYARKIKAAAKLRGLTIKAFVKTALDNQYPDI